METWKTVQGNKTFHFSKLLNSMTYPVWYHVERHGQSIPKMYNIWGSGVELIDSNWPPKLVETSRKRICQEEGPMKRQIFGWTDFLHDLIVRPAPKGGLLARYKTARNAKFDFSLLRCFTAQLSQNLFMTSLLRLHILRQICF